MELKVNKIKYLEKIKEELEKEIEREVRYIRDAESNISKLTIDIRLVNSIIKDI